MTPDNARRPRRENDDDAPVALVRRVDPLTDPRTEAEVALDTEVALEALLAELDTTDRPDPRPRVPRRTRRRLLALGTATAAAAAAAAAVIVVDVDSSGPAPADAAVIKARAREVLTPRPGTIFEVDEVGTQVGGGGPRVTWSYRFWASATYPYPDRVMQIDPGGTRWEIDTTPAGYREIYDARRNRIDRLVVRPDLSPGPRPGTETLTVPAHRLLRAWHQPQPPTPPTFDRSATTRLTVTVAQAAELRTGALQIAYPNPRPLVRHGDLVLSGPRLVPSVGSGTIDPAAQWADPIKRMLADPASTVDRHATLDGRPAIKVTGRTGAIVYWIARVTLRPLREVIREGSATVDLRFPTYRTLPVTAATKKLLSLAAQHPAATLDTDRRDYNAALRRIH